MGTGGRARDIGWWALIALMGVLTVATLAAGAWSVGRGDWGVLVRVPGTLLFAYWTGVGAWRRTRRGRITVVAADLGPTLTATHARRMVLLAAACPIALTLALALQAAAGRS